ncbi:MAG: hypothetical protein AABZ47_01020 [Planctomycetota bacterium]
MSKAFVGAVIAAAAFTGCTKSSEEGGRAGNDTFRIVVPAMAAGVKQGEVQTVRVVLERGDGFKQRVKLEVKAPVGMEVEPKEVIVLPGDKGDVQLKITVAKDAPIGEHKVLAKATPDKGEPTETEFKIAVIAK